ncbi:Conserved hypothetical secreted protein [Xanthomonas translucens pv. translucens DSM 18974]|uniref:Conserved hypothetical secreted protein n=1 Tax=Xanthomonas translucens pv. translucens DSM 18974 TaxID=1261556 RepID=A0A1C3TQ41_XANCT|nr:putative protein Mb2232 [Xanthomonas translucens pv. translucens DSM 18974]SCB05272.1 Conserved hypothetical secreted protein [Xanthomonas translucens pv. translucens DSM 18974]
MRRAAPSRSQRTAACASVRVDRDRPRPEERKASERRAWTVSRLSGLHGNPGRTTPRPHCPRQREPASIDGGRASPHGAEYGARFCASETPLRIFARRKTVARRDAPHLQSFTSAGSASCGKTSPLMWKFVDMLESITTIATHRAPPRAGARATLSARPAQTPPLAGSSRGSAPAATSARRNPPAGVGRTRRRRHDRRPAPPADRNPCRP